MTSCHWVTLVQPAEPELSRFPASVTVSSWSTSSDSDAPLEAATSAVDPVGEWVMVLIVTKSCPGERYQRKDWLVRINWDWSPPAGGSLDCSQSRRRLWRPPERQGFLGGGRTESKDKNVDVPLDSVLRVVNPVGLHGSAHHLRGAPAEADKATGH